MTDIPTDRDNPSANTEPNCFFLYRLSNDLQDLARAITGLAAMAQLLRQNDDLKDTEHGPTLEDEMVLQLHAGLEGIACTLESELDNLQARIATMFDGRSGFPLRG